MKIRFLKDYNGIKAGSVSHPELRVSMSLIHKGIAEEYKPDAVVVKKTRKPIKK